MIRNTHASISIPHNEYFAFEKTSYSAGKTNNVSTVDDTKPPMTTIANGFYTSEPMPVANNIGIKPKADVAAVINTGRKQDNAPSNTAFLTSIPPSHF